MERLEKCPPYQDMMALQNVIKNKEYNVLPYNDILVDETRKAKKIKKSDYLEMGDYAIIDQGQEYIGGYTNERDNLYTKTPFIIFGDHTRIIKYVNHQSFIGADGVKILNIKKNMLKYINLRYIYYYLGYVNIPNDGYSRHFKYIKNLLYIIPSMEIQKQIVEVLDKAQKLIDNRKEQMQLLDDLIESIFYDMFGGPIVIDKGWKIKKLGDIVDINPKKSEVADVKDSDLKISFVPMEDVLEDGKLVLEETKKISEVYKSYTYFKENDVLFAKITPCMENGKGCIAKGLVNNLGFGSTEFHVLRPKDNILTKEFIFYLTKGKEFRKEAENEMTGSAGQKRVPKRFLEDYIINIPPLSLQNQFAQKVELIEAQKELMEQSLTLMEDNYNSLIQRAFKGELF